MGVVPSPTHLPYCYYPCLTPTALQHTLLYICAPRPMSLETTLLRRDPLDGLGTFIGVLCGVVGAFVLGFIICCCVGCGRSTGWPPESRRNRVAPWNQPGAQELTLVSHQDTNVAPTQAIDGQTTSQIGDKGGNVTQTTSS